MSRKLVRAALRLIMTNLAPTPLADLDVTEVEDGLVVYDASSDRVHYLNPTASFVFLFCDGARDSATIAGLLQRAHGLDEPPVAEVGECLGELVDKGIVR